MFDKILSHSDECLKRDKKKRRKQNYSKRRNDWIVIVIRLYRREIFHIDKEISEEESTFHSRERIKLLRLVCTYAAYTAGCTDHTSARTASFRPLYHRCCVTLSTQKQVTKGGVSGVVQHKDNVRRLIFVFFSKVLFDLQWEYRLLFLAQNAPRLSW